MSKKRLLQTRNKLHVNKDKVSRINVRKKAHLVVHGVSHMIADSVMNGINYPREAVDELATSLANKRIVMPANHPEGEGGEFISATDPWALTSNHIGAYAYNFSMQGDRLISDVAIDPEVAALNEHGKTILNAIENGEPMDMSTGFYLNIETTDGFGRDGEPFQGVASNLFMDHSAFLPDVVGAKNKFEGVGLHTNSATDTLGNTVDTDIADLAVNASTPAMQLPLAPNDYQWNEADAIERIRTYTNSEKAPSTSYRKFFMKFNQEAVNDFASYEQPFADVINGVPHAVKQPLAKSESSHAQAYNKRFAANKKGPLDNLITWAKKLGYNSKHNELQTNDDGDRIMLTKLTAILNQANVQTDGLDEDAILAKYNEFVKKDKKKDEDEEEEMKKKASNSLTLADVTAAVNAAIAPLQTQLNASADKELNEAVESVVAMNKGIDETAAKAMGLVACNAFLAANGHVAFNASSKAPAASGGCLDLKLPNVEG